MFANYHTHTFRCKHAQGTDEEYIKTAIAEGVKILGFSDHAPYLYPNGYISYYKMTPEETGEYFSSLTALKEKYSDKIEIHIGYEAEYYPKLWNKTFEFWKNGNRPEYLLLGQHFICEEYPYEKSIHSYGGTENPAVLAEYVDTVITAINTKKFTCLAHPDVIGYRGPQDAYFEQMTRLMETVKAVDVPIEINLLGLSEGRKYPNPLFWEIASKYSPKTVLGCDAHEPSRVAVKEELTEARRCADKYKLEIIDSLRLVDPFAD